MTTLYLLYLFARSYWLATGLLTVACLFFYWRYGPAALQPLIYCKLITSAILMVSNYRRKFPGDVFYLNFGVSLRTLVVAAVTVDLGTWILATVIV